MISTDWENVWILFTKYLWLGGMAALVVYSSISLIRLKRKLIGATVLRDNIYLADYIEPTRTFEDCIRVRKYFYEEALDLPLEKRLNTTLLLAFDLTVSGLLEEGRPIHPQTIKSRNFLLKNS